jgi:hypothetical protein
MTGKQVNRYAEMVRICHGNQPAYQYIALEGNVLVSGLAGELQASAIGRGMRGGPSWWYSVPK